MRPTTAISDRPASGRAAARRRAVLRGALGDHRTGLGDEPRAVYLARDDQLPSDLERRGNGTAVDDRNRAAAAGAVGEREGEHAVALLANRPLHDRAGQLVGGAGVPLTQ